MMDLHISRGLFNSYGSFMIENPTAARVLSLPLAAPVAVAFTGTAVGETLVRTVCHVAMTALSLLATIFTLGLSEKAVQNLQEHSWKALQGVGSVIILPLSVPVMLLVWLCTSAATVFDPKGMGHAILKYGQ